MQHSEPGGPGLEIQLLGPIEATINGRPLALGRRKQRALVALLALNANRVVSTDELVDALWGERPPATASVALYGLVSALRKLLEPDGMDALVTKSPGYMLELPAEQTDVGRFERLAAAGRRELDVGDPEAAAARFNEALGLWRGPPLQDLGELPFARVEAARLEETRLAVHEARIDADLARGRDGDLVPELESLVAAHPLRERLRGQLMLALYRCGRQADALSAYRDARAVLTGELGLEPSEELHALESAILRHDPSVARPTSVPRTTSEAGPQLPPERMPWRRRRWLAAPLALVAAVALLAIIAVRSSNTQADVRAVANGIGVIDDGKLVAAGIGVASPSEVAATRESVWVTSSDEHTLSRVDPDTGAVRQTIRVGSGASGVAADGRNVWVANSLAGTISRVDAGTNTVVETIPMGSGPAAVTLSPRTVWVASRDAQTITQLDARSGDVTARIPAGAAPRALVFGAGSLWVADERRGVVFRLDPARRAVVDTIGVGNGPAHIAFGHGSVWVANTLDSTVSRIDPSRGAVTATVEVGNGPRGIAANDDGVWVSNEFDGTLALVDPRANRVTRVLRLGERPQGVAAARGRLFVAIRAAGSAHRGGTLRATGTPPQRPSSIDTLNVYVAGHTMLTNDGLVGYRRVGGVNGSQLVPNLAIAIPTPTDGGRTYTFRLRSGIRFSNGRLLRPADVRRTFERGFLVLGLQIYASYYGGILGAETCRQGSRCDLSRGIVIDDAMRTVTFHLRRPDPDFLAKLAFPFAFVVPADSPAKEATRRALPATGPYMVSNFRPGRPLTLVRNPRFREWSKAAQPDGYPDRIVFTAAKSTAAAVRAVESGRQDISLDGVPSQLVREVSTQYAGQVHVNPLSGSTYLYLNTKAPPFDDVRVRRALNYAADRSAAVRVSQRAVGGEPTCQILPPEFPGFRRYCPYTVDPQAVGAWKAPDLQRARRLVAASGTRGALVSVWVPENHRGEGPFTANLLRSLGYRVRLRHLRDDAYIDLSPEDRGSAQAGLMSWFADVPTASNFFDTLFSCASSANWSGFCDQRINRRIQDAIALQTGDPYLANQLWSQLDRAIVDRAPFVPLVSLKQIDIVSRRVGNYHFHPMLGVILDQLWVR